MEIIKNVVVLLPSFMIVSLIIWGLVRWYKRANELYQADVQAYAEWQQRQAAAGSLVDNQKGRNNRRKGSKSPRVQGPEDQAFSTHERSEKEDRDLQQRELAGRLADSI